MFLCPKYLLHLTEGRLMDIESMFNRVFNGEYITKISKGIV